MSKCRVVNAIQSGFVAFKHNQRTKRESSTFRPFIRKIQILIYLPVLKILRFQALECCTISHSFLINVFFRGKIACGLLVYVWVEIKTSLEKHEYQKHLCTRMESELEETKCQLEQLIRLIWNLK